MSTTPYTTPVDAAGRPLVQTTEPENDTATTPSIQVPNLQKEPPSPMVMPDADHYGDYVLSDDDPNMTWEEDEDVDAQEDEEDDAEEDEDADDEDDPPKTTVTSTTATTTPTKTKPIKSTDNNRSNKSSSSNRRHRRQTRNLARWKQQTREKREQQQHDGDIDDDDDDDDDQVVKQPLTQSKSLEEKGSRRARGGAQRRQAQQQHRRSASGPISTAPIFRYIRSLATKKQKGKEGEIDDDEDDDEVDIFSGEDGDDEGDAGSSSTSSAVAVEEDMEEEDEDESWDSDAIESDDDLLMTEPPDFEWSALPVVPNSFIRTQRVSSQSNLHMTIAAHHPTTSPYLDANMWSAPLTKLDGLYFVWEHSLLLQAVLQLLAERERVGVEGSIDAVDNIQKKGPLKKLSFAVGRRKMRPTAGAWVVKYVELRQGNLTYYQDSGNQQHDAGRKIVHLRQHEAQVEESTEKRGPGFVFELLIQGSPAMFWSARSEEERQAWIRAIQGAMIGEKARKEVDMTPYQESLKVYQELRETVQTAETAEVYLEAAQKAATGIDSLQLPVQWVRDQHQRQVLVKSKANEFLRALRQLSFSINGYVIMRTTPLAAERVVGSLTRCILELDPEDISELQAVSYARSILLSVLQGIEQEDEETIAKHLLQGKPELMQVTSVTEEDELDSLTRLQISFAGDDFLEYFDEPDSQDMSNWIMLVRRKSGNSNVPAGRWKKRYAVLSGAVLSFYEASSPRPHGLRLQLVLDAQTTVYTTEMPKETSNKSDASSANAMTDRRYVVIIKTQGSERLLSFDQESDMQAWKQALTKAIELLLLSQEENPAPSPPADRAPPSTPVQGLVKGAERVIKTAADGSIRGGIRVIKGAKDSSIKAMKLATDSGMKAMKIATDGSMKMLRGIRMRSKSATNGSGRRPRPHVMARVPSFQLLMDKSKGVKQQPTVQCVVQRVRTFQVQATVASATAVSPSSSTPPPAIRTDATAVDDTVDAMVDTANDTTTPRPVDSDPTTPEQQQHWLTVQVTWTQAFLMSGGPSSGRINSGDAFCEVSFLGQAADEDDDEDDDDEWVGEIEVL